MGTLKQTEADLLIPELCSKQSINSATFLGCRTKFDGMDATLMNRMKKIEDENPRLPTIKNTHKLYKPRFLG
ncbi:MAG: putative transposase [Paraglaciecola sp.]|jgi:putative transposase